MKLFYRFSVTLISPLCVISLLLSTLLLFLCIIFDLFLYIFTNRSPFADSFISRYFDEIAVGWYVELKSKISSL